MLDLILPPMTGAIPGDSMTPEWRLERLGSTGTSGGLPVPRAERGGRCYCPFAIFPARAPQMPEEGALASRCLCHAGITVARLPSFEGI